MKSDDIDCANEPRPCEFEGLLFVPWFDAQANFRINLHTLDGPGASWCKDQKTIPFPSDLPF